MKKSMKLNVAKSTIFVQDLKNVSIIYVLEQKKMRLIAFQNEDVLKFVFWMKNFKFSAYYSFIINQVFFFIQIDCTSIK